MDANTNLLGPNPVVPQVLARPAEVNHYPTPYSDELRSELAKDLDLEPDQILVGAGSDELFDVVMKAFVNPGDPVCAITPSFSMYRFFSRVHLSSLMEVPLQGNFELNAEAVVRSRAKVTFVASPNNPTGNAFQPDDLLKVIYAASGIVVLDEAYVEFSKQDLLSEIRGRSNLIITRTFSKGYGLAGMRVGYALGSRDVMNLLTRVKTPYTVGMLSERAALQAVREKKFLHETVQIIVSERSRVTQELTRMGLRPYPSAANFLLVDLGRPGSEVADRLKTRGILVKTFPGAKGLERCIRVTIGRAEQNDQFLAALKG
jgi:histidinol-phosphate aminotransferase